MKKLISIALVLALTACAGSGDLKPGQGTSFETKKPYNQVWNASVKAVTGSGLAILEQNKSTGVIKAEKGAGVATWGEVVGVFITPPGNGKQYTVEVVSMKRGQLQITGQDWEQSVSARIKAELGI